MSAPERDEEADVVSTQLPSLGALLRAAREDAGMTLAQVSARTRIRTAVLSDLEAGDLSSSGGPVYARGHLRSIAKVLGGDPAPLLEALDAEAGAPPPTVPVVGAGAVPATPDVPVFALRAASSAVPERRGANWSVALVSALVVLVALLAVGQLTGDPARQPSTADDVLAGATRPPAPVKRAPRPSPLAKDARAAAPRPTGAALRVRAVEGRSWISVRGATGVLFEGVLAAGQPPRDFADPKELRLVVGNAAAVNVICGGKDLGPAGGAGAVRRFTCSPDGLVPA